MNQDNPNDDFTKEIIQFIYQLVPYFIMNQSGFINPLYLICLPILVRIAVKSCTKVYKYILNNNDDEDEHFIQYYSRNDDYNDNRIFTILNWYLSNRMDDLKITQLLCEKYVYLEYGKTKMHDKVDPSYELIYKTSDRDDDDPEILYNYNGVELRIVPSISSHKTNKKTIDRKLLTIYADDLNIIKDFIKYCQEEYQGFAKNQDKKYYQYFEWDDDDNEWCNNKIHTNKTFDNIFLESHLKTDIIKTIDTFIKSKEFYEKVGVPYKKGLIFYGEPGCGKTSTEYAIANYYKRNIYIIRLDELNTTEKLKRAIRQIEEDAIVVFEDIDAHYISHSRTKKDDGDSAEMSMMMSMLDKSSNNNKDDNSDPESDDDNDDNESDSAGKKGKNDSKKKKAKMGWFMGGDGVFQTLLEVMDGYNFLSGAIIIFTTNHIDKLDEALIRPGRIDHKYQFEYPSKENIIRIFQSFFELDKDDPYLSRVLQCEVPKNFSSAELINGIIMPNIENIDDAINKYVERITMKASKF